MSDSIPSGTSWEGIDVNEPLAPALNNIDNDSLEKQEKERYRQDTHQRKLLARWVIWVDTCWLALVLLILFLQGFGVMNLDKNVLNVLLATTTVNVLGLAYIVLEGLFGKSKRLKTNTN